MNNKININIKSLFTFSLIILSLSISTAQSIKTQTNDKESSSKIWYGINVGNIGIYSGQFNTNIALMGGYKITENLNIGAIVHGYYAYQWHRGDTPNTHIFDYGYGGLANMKVYRNYFAQIEVDEMYITRFGVHKPFLFTYIGGGYKYQSPSKWSMVITLLYNVNPETNQEIFPLDYRAAFVYNF